MTTLTESELQTLATKEGQAKSGQIGYWQIYHWLGDLLLTKGMSATDSDLLWLRGATEANAGRGAMSELIRTHFCSLRRTSVVPLRVVTGAL